MSEKVSLPDGAWAVLRSPSAVPERLRRPVVKAMFAGIAAASQTTDNVGQDALAMVDNLEVYSELNDLVIVARVAEWSFDLPIVLDSILDLPGNAYDHLKLVCAEGLQDMMPDFSLSNDPDSPTSPSGD